MNRYDITFRSVTHAQRGEALLRRSGLRCSLHRTPRWMEEQGCGYSLTLQAAEIRSAVQLLRDNRVPLRRVYRHGAGDTMEEVPV